MKRIILLPLLCGVLDLTLGCNRNPSPGPKLTLANYREVTPGITKAQVGYPQILSAYDAVTAWIRYRDVRIDDCAPREIYFADWDAAGPDDEVCDVAYPLP